MDPKRLQRIRGLQVEATLLDGSARAAFLDDACRGDPELRRDVEALLAGEPPPPPDPLPQSIGPYEVESELGRGGMGIVYEARDSRSGDRVAVKVVHAHLASDARLRERFLREAGLGKRVDHPGVVRTLDVGEAKGVPYLAMEMVRGRTLRELREALRTVPERLLREIGAQVAEALAAVHAAGIVHRDLKPENILLTDDQRVRLMDLGVAKVTAATVTLTTEGQFLGSLHYAAPEQCEVGDVGPAADLYALGVVLYELATGDNPFRHDSPGAVIRSHLSLVPPPAAERNPEVSEFTSAVLATLLEKDPGARFPSARALAEALREGESGSWWVGRPRRVSRIPRLPVRRDARLQGRDSEVRTLEEAVAAAREGRGGAVLVEGEDGIGKTRVVDASLRAADGVQVLYGCFTPGGGMAGLADAVTAHFGADLEGGLAAKLDRPARLVASFAAFLRGEAPAQKLDGDALPSLFRELLRALAQEQPTVWIVDDLHFAPPQAVAMATALARAAAGGRALVVLTAAPGEALQGVEGARRLRLGRLSPREVVEMLRDLLRSEGLADRLGGKIAYKSDGVPFFILEMVRGLEEGLFLRRRADGSYEQTRDIVDIEVPSAVREVVAARLNGLGRPERAVLDVGAVQGNEFDADLVAAVLGRPLVGVLQDLAEIERRRGVVRATGRLYRFDHHQIQDVLLGELPPRLAEEYHGLLADAFASLHPGTAGGRAAHFLASHYLASSRPALALPHLVAALEHLLGRYQPEQALDLADRALAAEGLLQERARLDVLLRRGSALDVLGLRERHLATAEEAVALAETVGDDALRSRAHRLLGSYLWAMSRLDEALAQCRLAVDLAHRAGDRAGELAAALNLGMTLQRTERTEEAEDQFLRCLAMAVETGDKGLEAVAAQGLALTSIARGELERALSAAERCRVLGAEAGNRRLEGYAHGSLGLIRQYLGHYELAREHYERHLAYGTESGERRAQLLALGNLGFLALSLGRYEEAQRLQDRQTHLAREIHDRRLECSGLLNRAELHLVLGDFTAARAAVEEAAGIVRELEDVRLEGHVQLRQAELAEHEGDLDEARRLAGLAVEGFRKSDRETLPEALLAVARLTGEEEPLLEALAAGREMGMPGYVLLALAHLAKRGRGRPEEVEAALADEPRCSLAHRMEARMLLFEATGERAHLEEARRLLAEARAGAPTEWRDAMVERVPLHRAVAAASLP